MLEFIKSKFAHNEETTHLLAARSLDQVKDEGDLDKYKLVYWVSMGVDECKISIN